MVVHEAGHFFVARAFGMRVNKFSIGFGPTFFKIEPIEGYFWFTTAAGRVRLRLWKHDPEKHGPTIYQAAMIPFLAYVQIAGMNPLEEVDPKDKGSYANASVLGRILTIFAGPAANYVFASVLFFASLFFGGRMVAGTEIEVVEGRRAAAAQMRTGDRIVEIGGVKVEEWEQVREQISKYPEQSIPVVVERAGERVKLTVTPADEKGEGKIGVISKSVARKVSVSAKDATILSLKMPPRVVAGVVVNIGKLIVGKGEGELAGPIGMAKETARAAQSGWMDLLFFLGLLSAFLGAFNLVPFPALDGGRLMFLGYEATTRRRPNARIEAQIHLIGIAMLFGLMIYVTIANDLRFK